MYFTKLASNFIIDYEENLEKEQFVNFGSVVEGKFRGLAYHKIQETYSEMLLNFIPEAARQYFSPGIMKINTSYVNPHIDNDICTAINFYISTADAITVFYKFRNDNPKEIKIKNQTSGSVFRLSDLLPVDNFQAEPGEVWLLDVTKPHAVFPKSKENRIAFCLHSKNLSYSEAKEMLLNKCVVSSAW